MLFKMANVTCLPKLTLILISMLWTVEGESVETSINGMILMEDVDNVFRNGQSILMSGQSLMNDQVERVINDKIIKTLMNSEISSLTGGNRMETYEMSPQIGDETTFDEGTTQGIDSWVEILMLAIPCVIIMLFTVIGNILVIVSVFTYRPLKNVANMYMVSLALADIAVSVCVMPFNVIYTIRGKWDFGLFFCKGWLTCDILCCTASILNLCAIAVDRYQAIHDPINYARKRTMNRVVIGIGLVWVLSALIAMPPLLGWNDWPEQFTSTTPCTLTSEPGFVIYSSSGTFFIPLIIMTIVYYKIYVATKKRLRKRAQQAQDKINMRSMSGIPPPSTTGKKSSFGMLVTRGKKKSKVIGLTPGTAAIVQEEISVNPRRSSSAEDEGTSPTPNSKEQKFEVDGPTVKILTSKSALPVTVTINQASDPTDESESEDDEKGSKEQQAGEMKGKKYKKWSPNRAKTCSHLSLTSMSSNKKNDNETNTGEPNSATKSSSLTQLVEQNKCDGGTNDDQGTTPVTNSTSHMSPVTRKSLLKTPSFGMGRKKRPEGGRFTRNNNNRSSIKSDKSSKSVHIQIIDEDPSVMNAPSTSSASATTTSAHSGLAPGGHHSSLSISGNYSSGNYSSGTGPTGGGGNYISGNAASVSSLCPPTTTTSETTTASQVSQIWEEKQRISLSRERKAARVLGIVMGLRNCTRSFDTIYVAFGVRAGGVFVLCWLPFFLMYVILPFTGWPLPRWAENLITWLGYVNSALNPIIYTIFNQDFRKSFKRILTCETYKIRRRQRMSA